MGSVLDHTHPFIVQFLGTTLFIHNNFIIHVGEIGIVYKGYVKKSDSHSIDEYLAIKTLKGTFARIYHYFSLLNPLRFQPQNNYQIL